MDKIALVTGATAGIGKATALMLAKNKFNLILTGRRLERLNEIKKNIERENGLKVFVLNFDIRNNEEVKNAMKNLPEEWKNIDILINNAGLASGLDLIQDGDINDWDTMIDTNVKGLLYISRIVMPLMVKRGKGHIVNLSSIAGKETYLKGNVYCATKHAVEALTKGMRIDMLPHGIKVSSVSPGLVETEFSQVRFHGDMEKAKEVYQNFTPLYAEDIADAIEFAITRPPHVNINDIFIMPTVQANSSHLYKGE